MYQCVDAAEINKSDRKTDGETESIVLIAHIASGCLPWGFSWCTAFRRSTAGEDPRLEGSQALSHEPRDTASSWGQGVRAATS